MTKINDHIDKIIAVVFIMIIFFVVFSFVSGGANDSTICVEGKLYMTYEYAPSMLSTVPVYGEDGQHLACPTRKE